jgi:hypothetical protein
MTAAPRALRTAVWSAAGGFAFGWAAKTLATPPPRIVDPLPALVAVAPQNLPTPTPSPKDAYVTADGRLVTPLNALDPASLVISPSDPCADRPRPRRK